MGQDRRCPASLKFLEKILKKMKFIVDKSEKVRYTKRVRCERYKNKTHRCVAQLGRALRSGRRGRRFKSCRIDEKNEYTVRCARFLYEDFYPNIVWNHPVML